MDSYLIIGAIGPDRSVLSVQHAQTEAFRIVLAGPQLGSALYHQDRLILQLTPGSASFWTHLWNALTADIDTYLWANPKWRSSAWTLVQNGTLRALIQPGGVCPAHRRRPGLLRRLAGVRAKPAYGAPDSRLQARHIRVDTGQGSFYLCDPSGGWNLQLYAPSDAPAGHIRRLPDGYALHVPDGQDRFLLLGIALYVLSIAQCDVKRAHQAVEAPASTIILQPGFPHHPRRHPRPHYPRRRWIDDPVDDGRRWIDDPIDQPPPPPEHLHPEEAG